MDKSRMAQATMLTRREVQVLRGVAAGLSDREIALRLLIFEPAVREHVRSACAKLRVRARTQAAAHVEPRAREMAGAEGRGRAS